MSHALPLLGKTHPLTGAPLRAIGFRRDGRPIWPVMGGDPSNDPPERPDDVPEATWDALGDPGKAALTAERSARVQAERDRDENARKLAAAQARPTPPAQPPTQPRTTPPVQTGDQQPDMATLISEAVAAAMKPLQDAEVQRTAETAANRVRDAVLDAARPLLHDPTDVLANVDLTSVVNAQGLADAEKVKAAVAKVITDKPHLARATSRVAPIGIGGGGPPAVVPEAERVKSILADMQKSAGVRVPTTP